MIQMTGQEPRDPAQRPALDEIDRRLIRLLQRNVRSTNRWLGQQVGLSAAAVASRIKRLREDKLLATTVVVDWQKVGYTYSAFLRITVAQHPGPVLEFLAQVDRVQSISRTFGGAQIIVHVLAQSLDQMLDTVQRTLALPQVERVNTVIATDYFAFRDTSAPLPAFNWNVRELPAAGDVFDEMDARLIDALIADGHQSNRQVASRLGVSEATIRARLQQLESQGIIRLIAMADPFALGEATAAYVTLRCRGGGLTEALSRLQADDECKGLVTCLGDCDILIVAVAESPQAMSEAIDRWQALDGLSELQVYPVIEVPLFRAHLARLL